MNTFVWTWTKCIIYVPKNVLSNNLYWILVNCICNYVCLLIYWFIDKKLYLTIVFVITKYIIYSPTFRHYFFADRRTMAERSPRPPPPQPIWWPWWSWLFLRVTCRLLGLAEQTNFHVTTMCSFQKNYNSHLNIM